MKKCLFALLLVPVLLLSACATAQVSYKLGNDYSVTVDYLIELQPGDADAIQYSNAISQYWSDMGFDVQLDGTDGAFSLNGTKHDTYDSAEAAVQAFSELLQDQKSLLQNASFVYTPSFDSDKYSLQATASLENVIRQSEVQNIPQGEIDALKDDADEGSYTLCVALPGEITATNADSVQDGVCMWTLKYGEARQISVETSTSNSENQEYYAALEEQQHRDEQWLLWCSVAAGALIAALVVVTILRNRKNQPLKVRVKKF